MSNTPVATSVDPARSLCLLVPGFPYSGLRAELRIDERDGRLVVRKTFHSGYERFLEREIFARTVLGPHFEEIPPLLECGCNYLISPLFQDDFQYDRRGFRLFPLDVAKQVVEVMERLYDLGYALLDFHPRNVLVDEEEGLKLVDWEFLHAYGPDKPADFLSSWDILGPPDRFDGDCPRGGATNWDTHWFPYVGLTIEELRSDSLAMQRIKRVRHFLFAFLPRQLDFYLPLPLLELKARIASAPKWVLRRLRLIR